MCGLGLPKAICSLRTGLMLKIPTGSKNTVRKRIGALRKSFRPPAKQKLVVDQSKIRSHSGRHRLISDMKAAQISAETGMKFARIKDKNTYMGYGEVTDEQAGRAMESSKSLLKSLSLVYFEVLVSVH